MAADARDLLLVGVAPDGPRCVQLVHVSFHTATAGWSIWADIASSDRWSDVRTAQPGSTACCDSRA